MKLISFAKCSCRLANLAFAIAALTLSGPAMAQIADIPAATNQVAATPAPDEEQIVDVSLPAIPDDPTHPMLRLTPDKAEIVTLDKPVRSFIVGNEAHMGLFMDTARRLILVPRMPGATYFTAIGEDGRVVMQRHVIISGPKENYVRIRRSCAMAGSASCESTQVYYCPDMCHNISIATQPGVIGGGGGGSDAPAAAAPANTENGAENNNDFNSGE